MVSPSGFMIPNASFHGLAIEFHDPERALSWSPERPFMVSPSSFMIPSAAFHDLAVYSRR
jgi:hypothetical protein